MFSVWRKFKGWVVLESFLRKPGKRAHARLVARELGISAFSAFSYLKAYAREGLLSEERVANATLYFLRNDSPLVKRLKQFYALVLLSEKRFVEKTLEENPRTTCIVLYGTMASGEYDEHSDFDVLVISSDKTLPKKAIASLGGQVTVNAMTLSEWRNAGKEFKASLFANHVVLHGAGLVAK